MLSNKDDQYSNKPPVAATDLLSRPLDAQINFLSYGAN